jgi:DNA sulfur modification protein DndD
MIIREVEINNFRIYKGQNCIRLIPDGDKNIIVVSGKNGFGKTTFLMSLVWCLYGRQMQQVDQLYHKEIYDQGGYPKYISNSINRLAKAEGDTKFSVSITFYDIVIPLEIPCKEIKITRTYSIATGEEKLEILINGVENELTEKVGNEIFITDYILPREIAKFFFFDAEKIVSMAEINTAEQRKDLSLAYSEVLGIKKYEDMRKELENLQVKLRKESASNEDREALEHMIADVNSHHSEKKDIEEKVQDLKDSKAEKAKEVSHLQEKLIREGNIITVDELNELKEKEAHLIAKMETLQNDLKNSYDIIPFALIGGSLLDVSNQLDHEYNYKQIKFKQDNVSDITDKVLTDLMEEHKNFSGTIPSNIYEFFTVSIRKLIRKHFFADTPDLPQDFRIIHEFTENERNEFNQLLNELKNTFKSDFKRISGDYTQTTNEINTIKRKIREAEANQENPIIADYRSRKNTLENEIFLIDEKIEAFWRRIGQLTNDIIQKEKKIKDLSEKINVSEQNKQKDTEIKIMISELRTFIIHFKEEKKKSLEMNLLDSLKTLMHKKDFITRVEVDINSTGDDIDIILYNNREEVINKESLSKGEQQMYASALLKGLVEESDIKFPVFIDSPMQKFDEEHSHNIIKHYYPKVSEQVVIFPLINKELTAKEFLLLKPNIACTHLINNVGIDRSEFMEVDPDEFINKYNELYNYAN